MELINSSKVVPPEVKGWNWGAFMFSWIWGIFNNVWIALLCLIPGVHLVMCWILGFKGNDWAWQNKDWPSVEAFHAYQRKWAFWGTMGFIALLVLFLIIPFGLMGWKLSTEMPQVKAMIDDFNPHRKWANLALATAESNERCYREIGRPLQVHGNVYVAHDRNQQVSEMSIPVRGPNGSGVVYVRTKGDPRSNNFTMERAEVQSGRNKQHFLLSTSNVQTSERNDLRMQAAEQSQIAFSDRPPAGTADAEELYKEVLGRVEQDPTVKKLLGSQIQYRVDKAAVNQHGPMGTADFRVELNGNGNSGMLEIKGIRSMNEWVATGANLEVKTPTGSETLRFGDD